MFLININISCTYESCTEKFANLPSVVLFVNYKNEKKTVADDWFFLIVFAHTLHKATEF